jgi:exopolyphosphatase / guanosine-5'-triphosphate,3'-diphosphate pyrophosphatase
MSETRNIAALDCGSNSTRLLISDSHGNALVREMHVTRLSEGVDRTGELQSVALERNYNQLRAYRQLMERHNVTGGLLVATSAVRDAKNGQDFLEQASAITGVDARLLSGSEEARLSFQGATADLPLSSEPYLIVDVGGGSTELAVPVGGMLRSFSMQLGCVRVAERTLGLGVPTEEQIIETWRMVREELDRAFAHEPLFQEVVGRVKLIGLAGTVATLIQLANGVSNYSREALHHQRASLSQVQEWRARLSGESPAERLLHPGMSSGREDVLHAGLYILEAVMVRFGVTELLSSENDILDGIIQALLSPEPN